MIPLAHSIAVSCYLGAAALAAAPFARPVAAPVRGVLALLTAGVVAHVAALAEVTFVRGAVPLAGLGPSLSAAGFALAVTLLATELLARDVSLTLVAAPVAALCTAAGAAVRAIPLVQPRGAELFWRDAHIALSIAGIAAFATAAAAGSMYLLQRRELRSRRFGAVFRFFPPLATLDRVNHVAAVAGWVGLTLGVALAIGYSLAYSRVDVAQTVWGVLAWVGVTTVALGRTLRGWQARRAAIASSVVFAAVLAAYVALRMVVGAGADEFL